MEQPPSKSPEELLREAEARQAQRDASDALMAEQLQKATEALNSATGGASAAPTAPVPPTPPTAPAPAKKTWREKVTMEELKKALGIMGRQAIGDHTPTPGVKFSSTREKFSEKIGRAGRIGAVAAGIAGVGVASYEGGKAVGEWKGEKDAQAKNIRRVAPEPSLPSMVSPVITNIDFKAKQAKLAVESAKTNLPPITTPEPEKITPPPTVPVSPMPPASTLATNAGPSMESMVATKVAEARAQEKADADKKLKQQAEEATAKQAALEKKHAEQLAEQQKMLQREVEIFKNTQTQTTKAPEEIKEREKTPEEMIEERREYERSKRMAEIEARNKATQENEQKSPVGYKMDSTTKFPPLQTPTKVEIPKPPRLAQGVTFSTSRMDTTDREKLVNTIPKPPQGVNVTSRGMGGYNITTAPNPTSGSQINISIPNMNEGQTRDLQLTPAMLAEVDVLYTGMVEKMFPKNTLDSWNKIKDQGAYGFMKLKKSEVPKGQELLWDELQKFRKYGIEPVSGLRSGKSETIGEYLDRGLQNVVVKKRQREIK